MMLFVANDANDEEYTSFGVAFVTTFCQMIVAAFTPARFSHDAVLAVSFMASEFFINIVMLNALIAIMGDTYGRVSATKQSRGLKNRAMYILERQRLMSNRNLANKRFFPLWLHALERDTSMDGETFDGSGSDGSAFSHQADKLRMDVVKMGERLEKQMLKQTEQLSKAIVSQERLLAEQTSSLAAVREQLDKLPRGVQDDTFKSRTPSTAVSRVQEPFAKPLRYSEKLVRGRAWAWCWSHLCAGSREGCSIPVPKSDPRAPARSVRDQIADFTG